MSMGTNLLACALVGWAIGLQSDEREAQPAGDAFQITSFTIDGGGGTSTGGNFELSGTIGQPDAGPGTAGMTGGNFQLIGGFWPGLGTEACTLAVLSSNPQNCAIDARQPTNLDGTNPSGFTSITLNMGCPTDSLVAGNFSVSVTPAGTAPTISSVVPSGSSIVINFSSPIPPAKWTCVTHIASNTKACLGNLPADANNDRASAAADIISLINHLNGVPPAMQLFQCDADRSNACNAADIIRLIDLLNGASAFDPWLGQSLPVCPSD